MTTDKANVVLDAISGGYLAQMVITECKHVNRKNIQWNLWKEGLQNSASLSPVFCYFSSDNAADWTARLIEYCQPCDAAFQEIAKSWLRVTDYSPSCRSLAQGHGFCVMVNSVSEISDRRQSRSNMWASTGVASGSGYIWLVHFSSFAWQIWP